MHIRRVELKRIVINNRRLLTRIQTWDHEFMTHSESASLNTVPQGIPVLDAQAAPVEPAQRPELLIVTGMSGAGRSRAAMALEDLDWYVVDNLPPQMRPWCAVLSLRAVRTRCRGGGQFWKVLTASARC